MRELHVSSARSRPGAISNAGTFRVGNSRNAYYWTPRPLLSMAITSSIPDSMLRHLSHITPASRLRTSSQPKVDPHQKYRTQPSQRHARGFQKTAPPITVPAPVGTPQRATLSTQQNMIAALRPTMRTHVCNATDAVVVICPGSSTHDHAIWLWQQRPGYQCHVTPRRGAARKP